MSCAARDERISDTMLDPRKLTDDNAVFHRKIDCQQVNVLTRHTVLVTKTSLRFRMGGFWNYVSLKHRAKLSHGSIGADPQHGLSGGGGDSCGSRSTNVQCYGSEFQRHASRK